MRKHEHKTLVDLATVQSFRKSAGDWKFIIGKLEIQTLGDFVIQEHLSRNEKLPLHLAP